MLKAVVHAYSPMSTVNVNKTKLRILMSEAFIIIIVTKFLGV